MKGFLIIVFSLISVFSIHRIENRKADTTQNSAVREQSSSFESGISDFMWGFDKTEVSFFSTTDNQTSVPKKRTHESFLKFFNISGYFPIVENFISSFWESPYNLFLIRQFSLSLWQVFLQ